MMIRTTKKIVFYEVNIDNYLLGDTVFKTAYGEPPQDVFLAKAYYFMRAAYVEGKLGSETKAAMYHYSTLDGYFYEYFENEKN